MLINTEDYASVLFEFDNGSRGSFTVSPVFAGRKNRLFYELSGSKCSMVWDQERPNEMWIGYREKANEILMKDPSLLSARAGDTRTTLAATPKPTLTASRTSCCASTPT